MSVRNKHSCTTSQITKVNQWCVSANIQLVQPNSKARDKGHGCTGPGGKVQSMDAEGLVAKSRAQEQRVQWQIPRACVRRARWQSPVHKYKGPVASPQDGCRGSNDKVHSMGAEGPFAKSREWVQRVHWQHPEHGHKGAKSMHGCEGLGAKVLTRVQRAWGLRFRVTGTKNNSSTWNHN